MVAFGAGIGHRVATAILAVVITTAIQKELVKHQLISTPIVTSVMLMTVLILADV